MLYWLHMDGDYNIKPFQCFQKKTQTIEKYDIYNKVNNSIKKELDSDPIYNKTFLKTKIKLCDDKAVDFHDEELPKVGANCICLVV